MKEAEIAKILRMKFSSELWNVTLHTNVLFGNEWRTSADRLVKEFQIEVVKNVQQGYTGAEPGVRIWTFSSSLMYSLTVFTTIGKRKETQLITKLLLHNFDSKYFQGSLQYSVTKLYDSNFLN